MEFSLLVRIRLPVLGLAFLFPDCPFVSAKAPTAQTDEVRQYEVTVKNEPVGSATVRISSSPDATTTTTIDTSVLARFFLYKYRYEFHGSETWQGDQLVKFDGKVNDNGKMLHVEGAVDHQGSLISIDGKQSRQGLWLTMTMNYWRVPTISASAGGNFPIIEPDTGTVRKVRLQDVGTERVVADGREIECRHCRISGDASAELWFDASDRLVRQQTVEQGYLTELRLARISHESVIRPQ
jgi:hypothetical protein